MGLRLRWSSSRSNATGPGDLQIILDMLMDPAATTDRVPMKLPPAWLEVRSKPDAFYERVAAFVRLSDEHGAKYGPRLAEDNGVPVGTVYSWVAEARKRGHLPAVEPKSVRTSESLISLISPISQSETFGVAASV